MAFNGLGPLKLKTAFAKDIVFGASREHLGAMTRLTFPQVIRIVADCAILGFSLALAFVVRFVWMVTFVATDVSAQAMLSSMLNQYPSGLSILLLIAIPIFVLSGFYTYGRAYQSRYKSIVVTQAVILAYLVFGALAFFLPDLVSMPRSVLGLGCAFTLALMLLSRSWSRLWRHVMAVEARTAPVVASHGPETVLLIGGAGYIGSALVPKLIADGYRVRILDLFLYGLDPIERWVNHASVELVQADFRQVDALVRAMRGVDQVVHLGGIVGDPACAIDEELTIDVNLTATRVIADVAKGYGVRRLLFASTCSVYGASDDILDERSCLNPVSLYARSKIASERVLLDMGVGAFTPVIVRFGTIYGLSGRTRFDLVVNLLTAKAMIDGEITIFGGDQWRPFVHVDDAALAVALLLRKRLNGGDELIFNAGSNAQNYTIRQVAELIHKRVPSARLVDMGSDGDRRNYRVRFDRIADVVGFRPQWTLEQGIAQVVAAIAAGEVVDYRDTRYSNAKFLTEDGGTRLVRRQLDWPYELIRTSGGEPANEPRAGVRAVIGGSA